MSSPYLISSYVNEDGNKVILEFSETLKSTENSISSPFTVTLDGTENGYSDTVYAPISSITSSGSNVEINLGSPINLLQQVKVTYKDKTDGNDTNVVEDLDGNDAKSFSNRNVRNLRSFISYTKDNLEDMGDPVTRTNTEDSNQTAVVFLRSDGSVHSPQTNDGNNDPAGNENNFSFKSSALSSGVSQIFSSESGFAALKEDGSVVTWGHASRGGDSSSVADLLTSGVNEIVSVYGAFTALKNDGSLVSWGDYTYNGGYIFTPDHIYFNTRDVDDTIIELTSLEGVENVKKVFSNS